MRSEWEGLVIAVSHIHDKAANTLKIALDTFEATYSAHNNSMVFSNGLIARHRVLEVALRDIEILKQYVDAVCPENLNWVKAQIGNLIRDLYCMARVSHAILKIEGDAIGHPSYII